MSVTLTINAEDFEYPEVGDSNWGVEATNWAVAVTQGMLQKAGGLFSLTAEVDFGASYGLKSIYYKSRTTNAASAGQVRLAVTDTVSWRNNANSGDLSLTLDGSNNLTFNGNIVRTGLIVNADISASAAIAFSKMAALTASRALVSDSSGVVSAATTTSTQVGYLSTTTSDVQVQIDSKVAKAGDTMTGALILNADPSVALGAATKQYVDSVGTGLAMHTACVVATTTAGTLASDFENGDTIDDIVLATGDRILIKNQAAPAQNGIYTVNASGAPTRATDADTYAELYQAYVFISSGTVNAATGWVCNNPLSGTINVDPVTFVQFSASTAYSADGQGIELTGSQFALELDGTTLSKSGSGVKVNQIANAQIAAAAAIAVNKLAALTASRAVVSDGSGFLASATTTATEIGYVNGVTSAIQTQLDARIAASVMTTNGDIITRAAGVPARLGIGSTGQVLTVSGGAPTWANSSSNSPSFAVYIGASTSPMTVTTTMTALPISSTVYEIGGKISRSGNTISVTTDGYYRIMVELTKLAASSMVNGYMRIYDTTASSTYGTYPFQFVSTFYGIEPNATAVFDFELLPASTYQVQVATQTSTGTIGSSTVYSEATQIFRITMEYLGPA